MDNFRILKLYGGVEEPMDVKEEFAIFYFFSHPNYAFKFTEY